MSALLILSLLLVIAAAGLFWQASRTRRAAGLPGGRVIYSDTSTWQPTEEPLYDALIGLTGRPDYLIEQAGTIIPVEVKSGRIPHGPYDSHILQVAAYCLLIERVYGTRPPHGVIHYTNGPRTNRTYAVEYTPDLESSLHDLIADIRFQERRKNPDRSHESVARCRGCGFRKVCDQSLA